MHKRVIHCVLQCAITIHSPHIVSHNSDWMYGIIICIFRNLFCINGGVPLASTRQRRFLFGNRISTKRTAYLSYILLLFSSPLPFSMFISYNMFWADRIEYRASLFIWPRRKPAVKIHLLMNKRHVSQKDLNERKHFLKRR